MPLDLSNINLGALRAIGERPKRNPITAGVSSGIDNLQGLGYSAAGAVADAVGLERARDWLMERAALNQEEAAINGRPDLEQVEDQDLSTALPFAAYQIAKQVPQIGASLGIGALTGGAGLVPAGLARGAASLPTMVGGGGLRAGADFAARRAALQTGQRFAGNLMGGAGLGSVMGAGSMYQESVEGGDPSPYAALAAAPLYGLTEGLPTAVLGNTLARGAFRGSMPTRMLKAAGSNAVPGTISELTQNEMEMGFNPTLTDEERFSRRLNAGVTGGLAEGAFGSLGGIRRLQDKQHLLPGANPGQNGPPPTLDPAAPIGAQGDLFTPEQAPLNQYSPMPASPLAEEQWYELARDRGMLIGMAQDAVQAGNQAQYEAVMGALAQVDAKLAALNPATNPAQRNIMSGVHEMVNGVPMELTNDELVGNRVPYAPTPAPLGGDLGLFDGADPNALPFDSPGAVDGIQPGTEFPLGNSAYPRGKSRGTNVRTPVTADELSYEGQPLDGEMEPVPQDARKAEVFAALRNANGGKMTAALSKFASEFYANLNNPDALDAQLQTANVSPPVLDAALNIAQAYQSQRVNTMAAEGMSRARPGARVGTVPQSNATEQQMRARQGEPLTTPVPPVPPAPIDTTDVDNRVQGGRQQQTAAARRQVLDSILEGAQNVGNARNRFIKALRKSGFKDTIIREDEQAAINRYFEARDAFDDGDTIPSSPNEMDPNKVPERKEKQPQKPAKPKRENENRAFQLNPPPSTDEDLDRLKKAQDKRARKAGDTTEPEETEDTRKVMQGEMFRKNGKPTSAADQNPPPKRKAKVKAKVGEQEVEVEIDDVDAKMASIQKDIDTYKAFIACLNKK